MSDPTFGGRLAPFVLGGTQTCLDCGAVVSAECAALHIGWHDWLMSALADISRAASPPAA